MSAGPTQTSTLPVSSEQLEDPDLRQTHLVVRVGSTDSPIQERFATALLILAPSHTETRSLVC